MTRVDYIGTDYKKTTQALVGDAKDGKRNEKLLNKIATNVFNKKSFAELDEKESKALFSFIDSEMGDSDGVMDETELKITSQSMFSKRKWTANRIMAYKDAFEGTLKKDRYLDPTNTELSEEFEQSFKKYADANGISTESEEAREAFILATADLKLNKKLFMDYTTPAGSEIKEKDLKNVNEYIDQSKKANSFDIGNFNEKFNMIHKALITKSSQVALDPNVINQETKLVLPPYVKPELLTAQERVVVQPNNVIDTKKHRTVWSLVKGALAEKENIEPKDVKPTPIANGIIRIKKDPKNEGLNLDVVRPGTEISLDRL